MTEERIKRMEKLLNKNNSLFGRLWMSIAVTSVILVLAVNCIWSNNMKETVYKNEIQSSSNLVHQLKIRIENIFNTINMNSYSFLMDSKVREIIEVAPQNAEIREENEEYIQKIFRKMKKDNAVICSVEFVGPYYNVSSEADDQEVDFEKLKQYAWYPEFSDYYLDMITPVYRNDYIEKFDTKVIGWARKITGVNNYGIAGMFLVEISYSNISSIMEEVMENSENQILMFDKRGNVLFQSKENQFSNSEMKELIRQAKTSDNIFNIENEKGTYTCIYEKSSASDWYITLLIDQEKLTAYISESVKQSFLIGFFVILVGFVIAYGISKYITKPIYQLTNVMKQVEKNHLDVEVPVDRSITEVAILSNGFNKMLSHIRNLIEDIRREEQEKKELEIKMLQAQINPHFLYNTLNCIRWKAIMHGEETISQMIISLIKLLEFSGKKTKMIVTIEKELEHAVSYLNLILYQYADEFDVVYDIDSEALSCYTVKFILQPLLENAVFHGIEPLEEKGKIYLQIKKRENVIYFEIKDNGVGMSEKVQNNISAFRGWGIFNVNERLKKYYGEAAMLNFESEEGVGTKIYFQIPIVTTVDEKGEKEIHEESITGR